MNTGPDAAAIGFQLGLARAARADAAAEPRQGVAGPDQQRQQVFQLRELDLQLAFTGPRPPCSLPSRVRAPHAKMSRISCVRSMILRPTSSSIWRSSPGVSSFSKIT